MSTAEVKERQFRREIDMRVPVTAWLKRQDFLVVYEGYMPIVGPADIVAGRFGRRIGRGIPPLLDGVAVELKLNDLACVFRQAQRNQSFVERSYAALPSTRCSRMKSEAITKFADAGIGLLSVTPEVVEVLVEARRGEKTNAWIERNLWRRCGKDYEPLDDLLELANQ